MTAVTFYSYVQFLIAGAAVLVPVFLLLARRHSALVVWICATCCVDVLNAKIFVNIPAAPIAGLILLPVTLRWLGSLWKTYSGRAIMLQCGYLAILGALFGFLAPWSSHGVLRAFNETARGRTIIYLGHLLGDWSIAVFIADYVRDRQSMLRTIGALFAGTTVAAAAGLLSYLTKIDFYRVITGFVSQQNAYRLHGLNYEPRGLGLVAAYGAVACIAMLSWRRHPLIWLALIVDIAAMFTAVALSAVAATAAAVVTFMLVHRRSRLSLLAASAAGLIIVFAIGSAVPQWAQQWEAHFGAHEVNEVQQSGANDWYQTLAIRTGAFDAPALLFLRDHPLYALLGTGPGLIVIPDTEEAARLPVYQWIWQQNSSQGIVVQPTIGLVLEVANGGLIDLALMLILVLTGWRSLERLGGESAGWHAAAGLYIGAAAIYAVQASTVSAIAYIVFGLGLAGERLARLQRQKVEGAEGAPERRLAELVLARS